ncbi:MULTISPECIES: hypothetical protein [Massilia]|uniref:Uncharacterized protein n=1 Tax=Massilia rubra TaxID=2607910 RepID=A0ABX0LE63_9BURK|nr:MULTISPECIES: hypothetical protein [Massilia]NHZ32918.1 hypothetical protein [Massilia rubra]NHZ98486.1 hypothetical protein [Massilia sp. CCM 8734]
MAKYMTQKMSSGVLQATTYYQAQSDHPSHGESGAFTRAATSDYATVHNITVAEVEVGTYKSNQGVPTGGNTKEIFP